MRKEIYPTFDRLRFPLILMVVFIHAQFSIQGDPLDASLYGVVSHFFTVVISQVAVPLFFFISGCLYFRDYKVFSLVLYGQKQKRRIKTLIVPFITWNSFFWLLFSLFVLLAPALVNGGIPNIAHATIKDVIWVYWGDSTGGPIDFPLWFIRDLITVTVLSPLIYFVIMKYRIGVVAMLILLGLWLFSVPVPVLGNNICLCLFFFSLGGYLNKVMQYKVDLNLPLLTDGLGGGILIFVFLLLSVLSTINYYEWKHSLVSIISIKGLVLVGIPAMYALVSKYYVCFDKCKEIIPADCVFFIFASHGFLITVIKRIIERLTIDNQIVYTLLYFAIVFISIAICVFFYKGIKIVSPKLLSYLTGR